jgi:hypothetical protein
MNAVNIGCWATLKIINNLHDPVVVRVADCTVSIAGNFVI